jgi:hypothetical protein
MGGKGQRYDLFYVVYTRPYENHKATLICEKERQRRIANSLSSLQVRHQYRANTIGKWSLLVMLLTFALTLLIWLELSPARILQMISALRTESNKPQSTESKSTIDEFDF